MKKSLYAGIAIDGIRKNKKLYIPYIITCIGLVTMSYIMNFLGCSSFTNIMYGVETVKSMFMWGSIVTSIFALIFLFYTNSFLMKNRKKEFGLYNVLGMGKRNIGKVVFFENLFIALIAVIAGLVMGILFSKMTELFVLNLIKADINYGFEIPKAAVINVLKVYGVIFLLIFLNSIRQIRFASVTELLASSTKGEKPLKGNWITGIAGIVVLGAGYFIAASIEDPYSALVLFFIAVVIVIVGTYLVMISGSVLICKLLQKNKKFYYKKSHFVSVSSMAYRMKRNGAGLASICILLTMVLVIVSTTFSMYVGIEDGMDARCPKQFSQEYRLASVNKTEKENTNIIQVDLEEFLDKEHIGAKNFTSKTIASFSGNDTNGKISLERDKADKVNITKVFYMISLDDYNRIIGENSTLRDDEVILINTYGNRYDKETIELGSKNYHVKKYISENKSPIKSPMMISGLVIIVPDFIEAGRLLDEASLNTEVTLQYSYEVDFDTSVSEKKQINLLNTLADYNAQKESDNGGIYYSSITESRAKLESEVYDLYGGIFALGVILSIIFICAAALIIYYKQITEGYEDQGRYTIMQKIGMTKQEIKSSINSQLFIVFALPLILAGIHMIFAFPMLKLILSMFFLTNIKLFVTTTFICFTIIAVIYAIVYKITSNSYYKIVSGMQS